MSNKIKVLIVQEKIPHYNVPVFNILNELYDLTVIYSEEDVKNNVFNALFIPQTHFSKYFNKRIINESNKYDVIISTLQYRNMFTYLAMCANHKHKNLLWGIGVAAGYEIRYDSDPRRITIYKKLIDKSDATIFYSDYPIDKYISLGIDKNKLFVAHNTVKINKIDLNQNRSNILFIGTLYKEKRVDLLIDEYRKAFDKNNDVADLLIIGDGPEKENIEQLINDYNLKNKVKMLGKITDEDVLAKIFPNVLLCISPDQAGLSVQKAMGYGTVFVTKKDAITGGEIFDIDDGVNGILIDDFNEISDIIVDAHINRDKYVSMGDKAYEFYWNNRTVEKKANGFIEAISYVMKN